MIHRRMGNANLVVQPGDISLRVMPIEAHCRPAWRLTGIGRRGSAVAWRIPLHVQDRVAGGGLVAGLSQEGEKLLAGDVVFAEREGLDRDLVLRTFGVEAPVLGARASHNEFAGRYSDHDRTL